MRSSGSSRLARHPRERGQAVVVLALSMVVLLGMIGLVLDGGFAYAHRRQMQNAADAGALDGTRVFAKHFDSVCAYKSAARQAATDAALANGVATASDVVVGLTDVYGNPTPNCDNARTKGVSVRVSRSYDTYFAPVIGINHITVGADAIARFGFVNALVGALPVVLNRDSVPTNTNDGRGHKAVLTPAAANGIGPVNFGTIDPSNYGQTLADALANGLRVSVTAYKGCGVPPAPCTAGSIFSIDSSIMNAIQARIDSAPSETWNHHAPNSRRVAVLLVLNGDIGNATVVPVGFAVVFLDSIAGAPNNALTVHFITDSIAATGATIDFGLATAPQGTPTLIQLIR